MATIIFESMRLAISIVQHEVHGRFSCQVVHGHYTVFCRISVMSCPAHTVYYCPHASSSSWKLIIQDVCANFHNAAEEGKDSPINNCRTLPRTDPHGLAHG